MTAKFDVRQIYPQLAGLADFDPLPAALSYEPILNAIAHEVLLNMEDPGDDEGHRYYLLAGGNEHFGVLILPRYFSNDPCLHECEDVYEAGQVVNDIARRIFWSANLRGAVDPIRYLLRDKQAGHRETGSEFLWAAESLPREKILEVLRLPRK